MADQPTVAELCDELRDVVNWQSVVVQLPGMDEIEVEKIEKDISGGESQKQKAFGVWLKRYPDASWADVRKALNRAKETKVEKKVADKHKLPPLQTEDPPLKEEATAPQTKAAVDTRNVVTANNEETAQPRLVAQVQPIVNPGPHTGEDSTDYGPPPNNQQQQPADEESSDENPDFN